MAHEHYWLVCEKHAVTYTQCRCVIETTARVCTRVPCRCNRMTAPIPEGGYP